MSCPKCGHEPDAVVSARWEFTIPRAVKSANAHSVNAGASRWAYAADRNAWSQWFALRLHELGPVAVLGKRRVTLTRVYAGRQREMDRANFISGCKPVLDAMVRAGWLRGDKPADVEDSYLQERGVTAGLRVLVEELAHSTSRDAKAGGA